MVQGSERLAWSPPCSVTRLLVHRSLTIYVFANFFFPSPPHSSSSSHACARTRARARVHAPANTHTHSLSLSFFLSPSLPLSLSLSTFWKDGALVFAKVLKYNNGLQHLNLGENGITKYGMAAIADSLHNNIKLTWLGTYHLHQVWHMLRVLRALRAACCIFMWCVVTYVLYIYFQ